MGTDHSRWGPGLENTEDAEAIRKPTHAFLPAQCSMCKMVHYHHEKGFSPTCPVHFMYRVGHLTFAIWTGYKKNFCTFFQKYGFIRNIEPFHLRMKHNIIQMTATAGLTVPHSINSIFQYIFDCLGKRSIRSISKIFAFGA